MGHLAEYARLTAEGQNEKAITVLLDALDTTDPDHPDNRQAALLLFRSGSTDRRVLSALERCVAGLTLETGEDVELVLAHAQLAWIRDQRDPTATRARDSARRVVQRAPDLPDGYRVLGLAHLSRQEYLDAYISFSAVNGLKNPSNFENFRSLAKFLMQGVSPISFELKGHHYKFDLTAHNAEAIESSANHSIGLLTEWEELQHLRTLVDVGSIDHIVEVGVLIGNHTAYFLKNLLPNEVTLIDADPENRRFIENTIAYNTAPNSDVEIKLHTLFVGDKAGKIKIGGKDVEKSTLDQIVDSKADLIKIDVDGGEAALLNGAQALFETSRPLVMIETAPSTHNRVVDWFTKRDYELNHTFERGGYSNVFFRPS